MPSIAANLSFYDFDVDHIAFVCIDQQRDFRLPVGPKHCLAATNTLVPAP